MNNKQTNDNTRRYFSDYFEVTKEIVDKYGAYDISLIADLPLFIDPFLLFESGKDEYQELHKSIIKYLAYLRDISISRHINLGRLKSLFYFSEVKQNYFGFSSDSNKGRGLGPKFAVALNANLSELFQSFGEEKITRDTHLEKLCLISDGVGKDMISDFTTNLIKEYLLDYTEKFTKEYIDKKYCDEFPVRRVKFDYNLEIWTSRRFILPKYNNDYIILTPKDMLTRENNWINSDDYFREFNKIVDSLPNDQLRSELNDYLKDALTEDYGEKEYKKAIGEFTRKHSELIDYFILYKEENGDEAVKRSTSFVSISENIFIEKAKEFIRFLKDTTPFYSIINLNSKKETFDRIMFLKDTIENKGLWKIFYHDGKAIEREEDVQLLFRLVWYRTEFDISREGNDGMGEYDYKVSYGQDKTLVEFKMADNKKLKNQLKNQLEAYKKASDTDNGYKVIVYFSLKQLERVQNILKELNMLGDTNIILIDATPKQSASNIQ
jgi:hypothetical protein